MNKEEQIKKLTDELLSLLNTPNTTNTSEITESEVTEYSKTINDLKNGLNVDVNIVRQIMKRVDEVYGKSENYMYTTPLYEEYAKIIKE